MTFEEPYFHSNTTFLSNPPFSRASLERSALLVNTLECNTRVLLFFEASSAIARVVPTPTTGRRRLFFVVRRVGLFVVLR